MFLSRRKGGSVNHGARASLKQGGFTLLEAAAVLLIVSVLLLIGVVSYIPAARRAEAAACSHNRQILVRAVTAYRATALDGSLPVLEELRPYVNDFDSTSVCPSDGTPYAITPPDGSIVCPKHP
jgi:prepilin-type N-terminal cleavage/methylation domain-containing protein